MPSAGLPHEVNLKKKKKSFTSCATGLQIGHFSMHHYELIHQSTKVCYCWARLTTHLLTSSESPRRVLIHVLATHHALAHLIGISQTCLDSRAGNSPRTRSPHRNHRDASWFTCWQLGHNTGAGALIAQWLERRTRDWKVQVRVPAGLQKNVLLQGQLFVLAFISYPFHPRVTAVARKRSLSFCQAKHTWTLYLCR